jgi:16S rRNA (adenine1518-N6/adenine1519-N6)-dimethyltransferase
LGQNFLIDLNLLEILASTTPLGKDDVALEVGAGTGGLTSQLAQRAGRVVSIEIDPGFFQLASRTVAGLENVRLIHADALKGKNHVNPVVLEALQAAMTEIGASRYHLAANLPYDVSASLIGNLLLEDLPIRSATVTVQLEMADRIVAKPGTKDYGPLSVLCQTIGTAEMVRALPPEAFWPRPQVRSAIVKIDVDLAKRGPADLPRLRAVHRFIRDLFIHRRKNLRGAVASIPGFKVLKPQLDAAFASADFKAEDRAECLPPERLHALFDLLEPLK